jgi:hypothetical protein
MPKFTLSRRSLIAGGAAAVPVLAVPTAFAAPVALPVPAQAPSGAMPARTNAIAADPIFAAIDKHRRAASRWLAAVLAHDRRHGRDRRLARKNVGRFAAGLKRLENRETVASNAERKAWQALLDTQPITIAGTLALVAYAKECHSDIDPEDIPTLLETVTWSLAAQVPGEIARSAHKAMQGQRS